MLFSSPIPLCLSTVVLSPNRRVGILTKATQKFNQWHVRDFFTAISMLQTRLLRFHCPLLYRTTGPISLPCPRTKLRCFRAQIRHIPRNHLEMVQHHSENQIHANCFTCRYAVTVQSSASILHQLVRPLFHH